MQTNNATKTRSKKPVASSKVGLRGIEDLDPRVTVVKEVASKGTDLGVWIIKGVLLFCVGYWAYGKIVNRFTALPSNSNYPASNISTAQAQSRADAIANAYSYISSDDEFNATVAAFTTSNGYINYNGYIALYNAFGHHKNGLGQDLTLTDYIRDQFSADQISQLSFMLGGAFF